MTVKDDLHHLVDQLDDAVADEALLLLQDLHEAMLRIGVEALRDDLAPMNG